MNERLSNRVILNGLPSQAIQVQALATEAADLIGHYAIAADSATLAALHEVTAALHARTRQLAGYFEVEVLQAEDRGGERPAPQKEAAQNTAPNPREIHREPWWENPPTPGETEADVTWGYLVTYDNGEVRFLNETPTPEEIINRKGCPWP